MFFYFKIGNNSVYKFVRKDDDFQELLYKAMDLDFAKVLDELYDEHGIVLNTEEEYYYSEVISDNKDKIKIYKLIR